MGDFICDFAAWLTFSGNTSTRQGAQNVIGQDMLDLNLVGFENLWHVHKLNMYFVSILSYMTKKA